MTSVKHLDLREFPMSFIGDLLGESFGELDPFKPEVDELAGHGELPDIHFTVSVHVSQTPEIINILNQTP